MKKVCIVVGSRANYASIKSVMSAVKAHPNLSLQVVATASAVLARYGNVADIIERDGFSVDARLHMLIEGETPTTMAKSTGLGLIELSTIFEHLKPDFVLTVGDRFETMATTLAAAYMNIPIAHTMGGEVTGTIDESIRHAVTKFAHVHFPASPDARDRILKLGERPQHVHLVGCPRIDVVKQILEETADSEIGPELFAEGVGPILSLEEPFLLVSQHPVTTEFGKSEEQITATLCAVEASGIPAIVLWPNADAGSEDISRGIRKWRERGRAQNMHFFKNLPISIYVQLMSRTACLVGNSSSAIREGAFIGTPAVNIGSRQDGRERGENVVDVPPEASRINEAILNQVARGRFDMDPIYGDGTAGNKIADVLASETVELQKRITY